MPNLEVMNRLRKMPAIYGSGVALRDIVSLLKCTWRGSYSQHGEDICIADFFGRRTDGFYLDIGASHPFRISNTYLLYRLGWRGVTVEPIPRLGRLHRRWRPRDTLLPIAVGDSAGTVTFYEMTPSVLSTLDSGVADQYVASRKAVVFREYSINVVPINDVFEKAHATKPIDFVSVDIEGLDSHVLSEVDFSRYRPALFCIEFNNARAKRESEALFKRADYKVVREIACNMLAAPAESV